MDPAVHRLIAALHQIPVRYVLALTGGGATAAGLLLSVPGGARTILEAHIPYDAQALQAFLGQQPEQYCSALTSRRMAERAWERASWLAPRQSVAGIGCTASLVTDRPKRGDHRFHITIQIDQRIVTYSLVLSKGARDREGEETLLVAVLLNGLAETFHLDERLTLPLLPGEMLQQDILPLTDALSDLLRGVCQRVCLDPDGRLRQTAPEPAALLAGSFNPLHAGHCRLRTVAEAIIGQPVAFELSISNVDKPPLTVAEIRQRLQQFTWQAPLWLTQAATFVQKAELFPGVVFVVGIDTAARIVSPRYYHDDAAQMRQALQRIAQLGCRFLVAGRADSTGRFQGLQALSLPEAFRELFRGIPESAFREDISSTALRAAGR